VSKYEDHFVEEQASHSTSLRSQTADNKLYHVGPLARYSINFDKLSPIAQQAALEAGLASKCFNSYQSIIVRAVETLHACEESLRIIENYEPPEKPAVEGIDHQRQDRRSDISEPEDHRERPLQIRFGKYRSSQ